MLVLILMLRAMCNLHILCYFINLRRSLEFKQSNQGRHLKELCMHAVTEVAVAMLKLEAEVNEAAP